MTNILTIALCFVYIVVNMAAISILTKADNAPNRAVWEICTLLFGWKAIIVYLIIRKKYVKNSGEKTDETAKKTKSKRNIAAILLAASIICFAVICGLIFKYGAPISAQNIATEYSQATDEAFEHRKFSVPNSNEIMYYFDRNKKAYVDALEVPYYAADGTEYIYGYDSKKKDGLINNSTGEFHPSNECFVDKNGYLIIDSSLYSSVDEYECSAEKDGEKYYLAAYVSWDADGEMYGKNGLIFE